LRRYLLEPDLVPNVYDSEGLASALKERVIGQRVLLARADRGRDVLRGQLALVAEVEQIAVYAQVDAIDSSSEALELLRCGEINYVTLTSSNIARSLMHALDEHSLKLICQKAVQLVSISPVTSAAVRELGLPVAAEARKATAEDLIQAVIELCQKAS
jgi:uroporphyrinogen III methyltransferase / synthase